MSVKSISGFCLDFMLGKILVVAELWTLHSPGVKGVILPRNEMQGKFLNAFFGTLSINDTAQIWPYLCNHVQRFTMWKLELFETANERKIRLKILFEKCVCWRQGHNVLERKWSKSGVFSFIYFFKKLSRHKKSLMRSKHGQLYENEQKEGQILYLGLLLFLIRN